MFQPDSTDLSDRQSTVYENVWNCDRQKWLALNTRYSTHRHEETLDEEKYQLL